MGQEFDLPHAPSLAGHGPHEPFDRLLRNPVHAPERPQRVQVAVDGECSAEKQLLDRRAHGLQQLLPHAHPALAPRQLLGNLRQAQAVDRQQLADEAGLLQQAQSLVRRGPHQAQDAQRLVLAQRHVGHAVEAQLLGAADALEAVEQEPACGRVHALQWLFDAPLGNRRQEARFPSAIPQPMSFIPQVQARPFHDLAHLTPR